MTTITVPTTLTHQQRELVAIPRKEYEKFLFWQKTVKSFTPTTTEKKALQRARKHFTQAQYTDLKTVAYALGIKN